MVAEEETHGLGAAVTMLSLLAGAPPPLTALAGRVLLVRRLM